MLWLISFRNFLRQRRRNILLGTAIAFGVMVLTLANAFARGISDNLLNRIVIYMTGHIHVTVVEEGRIMTPVIRDQKMAMAIRNAIPTLKELQNDVGTYCRAVGRNKADYVYLVGTDVTPDFIKSFTLKSGSIRPFSTRKSPYPALLSESKAEALNVKVGDEIQLRYMTVNGQQDTATVVVAGILKSQNIFMDYATFIANDDLKKIMDYRGWETGALKIILPNPAEADHLADKVHDALVPSPAFWEATLPDSGDLATVIALQPEASPVQFFDDPSLPDRFQKGENGVIISAGLAKKLGLQIGDSVRIEYSSKFESQVAKLTATVQGIARNHSIPDTVIAMDADSFFRQSNLHWPKHSHNALATLSATKLEKVATEWRLLDRDKSNRGMQAEMQALIRFRQTQPLVSVSSMYESAYEIVQLEQVFRAVTWIAGSVLFGVIMIGVLNSLRMIIRERTQEFGTLRAIGMRRRSVWAIVMIETLFLAIAGWIIGVLLAFFAMKCLSLITFSPDNPFNMMMLDHRLYFLPTVADAVKNLLLLLFFSAITAWFPARSAAALTPAEAFRHRTQ